VWHCDYNLLIYVNRSWLFNCWVVSPVEIINDCCWVNKQNK
jgi:hypothetical protein